jgi:hypothetical protein
MNKQKKLGLDHLQKSRPGKMYVCALDIGPQNAFTRADFRKGSIQHGWIKGSLTLKLEFVWFSRKISSS